MTWSRRDVLWLLGGSAATVPLLGLAGCAGEPLAPALLVSASDDITGGHHITAHGVTSGRAFQLGVPSRGHGAALHPSAAHLAVVARRSGTEIYIIDLDRGTLVHTITAPPGRHYQGHAVYDRDGGRLFAVENDFDPAAVPDLTPRDSVIGVYDVAAGYARTAELPAHGVGGHEIRILDDGTLVLANGGIYTHPSRPRDDLNLSTMDPSLVYLDDTGARLAQHRLPDHQLGIRHLALGPAGEVAAGMQYSGDPAVRLPLVYLHTGRDQELAPVDAPDDAWDALDHYIASVAIHGGARVLAATSPLGGLIAFWDLDSRAYRGTLPATDVSGLAAVGDDFIATTGDGTVLVIDAGDLEARHRLSLPEVRWDNHLLALPGDPTSIRRR